MSLEQSYPPPLKPPMEAATQIVFVGEVAGRMLGLIREIKDDGMGKSEIIQTIASMLSDPKSEEGPTLESGEHIATLAALAAVLLVEKALP
jgi:hypothetical protein